MKQVFQGNFRLNRPPIAIMRQPVRCDHGDVRGDLVLHVLHDRSRLVSQNAVVCLVYHKWFSGIFHLADIDDIVSPLDKKVDLHTTIIDIIWGMPP